MDKTIVHSYCIIALLLILSLNCHAENATNVFDIRNECNTVEGYVAVVLFSLLLLYSIVGNVLLMVVFCSRDNLYSRAFIIIASQIIVCSFLNFIPQAAIVVLKIVRNKNFGTWIYRIFSVLSTFSFFVSLHLTFLLAMNRLIAICFPKFNAFFESMKFYFLLIFLWLSGFVISLVEFHYCIKIFNVSNFKWSFDCTKRTPESGAAFMKIRYAWTLAIPIAMFAIYILIFCSMRNKRKNVSNLCMVNGYEHKRTIATSKYERMMLIQAVFVCGVMEIQIFCFNFLSKLTIKLVGKEVEIFVNILTNCFVIFNAAVLPTANLIFVKRFRERVKKTFIELLFKIKAAQSRSTVVPITSITTKKTHRIS
ncbi:7 transmembrane receptor (rhodopsin family) protein [Brugia pahangi]